MPIPLDYATPSRRPRMITSSDRIRELSLIALFCLLAAFLPLPRSELPRNVTYVQIRATILGLTAIEDRNWHANELDRRIHIRTKQAGPAPAVYIRKIPPASAVRALPYVYWIHVALCAVTLLAATIAWLSANARRIPVIIATTSLVSASVILILSVVIFGWIALISFPPLWMTVALQSLVIGRTLFLRRQIDHTLAAVDKIAPEVT